MADTPNTCEVSLTSSLSEGFRQEVCEKGSKDLKFFFCEVAVAAGRADGPIRRVEQTAVETASTQTKPADAG
ncbi:hypothetical protein [Microcoleus anatoxicus]|uniref:hypothetical protein n=1 Tax=Microcoleus anatoxicus TaxID=2705319 RepID=UPI0030C95DB4